MRSVFGEKLSRTTSWLLTKHVLHACGLVWIGGYTHEHSWNTWATLDVWLRIVSYGRRVIHSLTLSEISIYWMRKLIHLRSQVSLRWQIEWIYLINRILVWLPIKVWIIIAWWSNTIVNICSWLSRLSCVINSRLILSLEQRVALSSIQQLSIKSGFPTGLRCHLFLK